MNQDLEDVITKLIAMHSNGSAFHKVFPRGFPALQQKAMEHQKFINCLANEMQKSQYIICFLVNCFVDFSAAGSCVWFSLLCALIACFSCCVVAK